MSLLAPLFSSTMAASTLLTAAAQCRADLPLGRPDAGSHGSSTESSHSSKYLLIAQTDNPRSPKSSMALTSAWQLMSSSTMPSTASRAARISGVVPSCMRASKSVARFLIRIWRDAWDVRVRCWPLTLTQQDYCETKRLSRAAFGSDWSVFVEQYTSKLDRKSLGKIRYIFKIKYRGWKISLNFTHANHKVINQ